MEGRGCASLYMFHSAAQHTVKFALQHCMAERNTNEQKKEEELGDKH